MNDQSPLSSFLHFLVELTLIGAAAAAFGLFILLAGNTRSLWVP